jgi:hypothetical protein
MIDWLLSPFDAARVHDVGVHLSWHARLMVLAWGVLVPIGVIAARYFKVMPGQDWPRELDNRTWWTTHRTAHYLALGLMLAGVGLILLAPASAGSITAQVWIHRWAGWATLALAVHQFLSGWLRGTKGGPTDPRGQMRGDHYDMTRRRVVFEALHKTSGYLAMCLAMVAIVSGLWQANAPRWMWIVVMGWWVLLVCVVWTCARRRRIPTYEAIWGPTARDAPTKARAAE